MKLESETPPSLCLCLKGGMMDYYFIFYITKIYLIFGIFLYFFNLYSKLIIKIMKKKNRVKWFGLSQTHINIWAVGQFRPLKSKPNSQIFLSKWAGLSGQPIFPAISVYKRLPKLWLASCFALSPIKFQLHLRPI